MRLDFSFKPKTSEDNRIEIAEMASISGITHLYVENGNRTKVYSKAPNLRFLNLFKSRVLNKYAEKGGK